MKKIALATAISTIVAAPAFAASYTTVFSSGTPTNPLAGFTNAAASTSTSTATWYVDPQSSTASNRSAPAISKSAFSHWTFDFTIPAAVAFTGTLEIGNFKTQSVTTLSSIVTDGRESYYGVIYSFSGVGSYDEATNTFTYNYFNSTINGGGAAVYSQSAPATCLNGATHVISKVCAPFQTVSKAWEGLALSFVFEEDRSRFEGSLHGTQTNGMGLSRNTTTINWFTAAIPAPPAAWLFGSALLGLAGQVRRRRGS
jgi:hypothetical protein